jgi:glycyl-tRNA synthetase
MSDNDATVSMDGIKALCKRRGFIYPASEIYGGLNGFWDYGPLGTALKNNLRDDWWRNMVLCPPAGPNGEPLSIVGLDSAIIQNPETWVASGHVGGFNDPMVDCRETKNRYRADQLMVWLPKDGQGPLIAFMEGEEPNGKRMKKIARGRPAGDYETVVLESLSLDQVDRIIGPHTTNPGTLTEPRQFNLMFKTYVGAAAGEENVAYLRPETAQGIFLNYRNVLDTMRVKVPFGIAQIGKAFRNEVTPRNYIFRSREFEQMEMEWFCPPDESRTWYEFWKEARLAWWLSLGISRDNLRLREHDRAELAHYAVGTVDVEYRYPFSGKDFGELEGVAHRGNFDLNQHQEHAKTKMEYFDPERNERYVPHVIEPASGLTRGVLVLLCEAYTPDPQRPSKVYMNFHPKLAPITAAIFPLVNKDGMPETARNLYMELRKKYVCQLDVKQNIGKRYARMDEAGTPWCFTIDGETASDRSVTVRDRNTLSQERVGLDKVASYLADRLNG